MCSGNQPTMALAKGNSHRVGSKRPPAAAGEEDRLLGRKRARTLGAGAMVPYVSPSTAASAPIDARPINAVPLTTVAPIDARPINSVPIAAVAPAPAGEVPGDPTWIRKILFCRLGLRYDLPVVFIEEKTVTRTDLDPHQNRFRLACGGVEHRLLPFLTHDEAVAASFLPQEEEEEEEEEEGSPPPIPSQVSPPPPQPERNTTGVVVPDDGEEQEGQSEAGRKRKKRKGRDHGGLPVTLVHLRGGIKQLLLTRWDSSGAAIIKGEGYLDFVARCDLMEKDVVHVWVFKQREFRLFGVTYPESPLYIVVADARPRFAAPPPPPPPALMIC